MEWNWLLMYCAVPLHATVHLSICLLPREVFSQTAGKYLWEPCVLESIKLNWNWTELCFVSCISTSVGYIETRSEFMLFVLLISYDLISTDLISLWLWPVRQGSATYFILIGRSHSKLGHFTAPSLTLSLDKMRYVEMRSRWDKWY